MELENRQHEIIPTKSPRLRPTMHHIYFYLSFVFSCFISYWAILSVYSFHDKFSFNKTPGIFIVLTRSKLCFFIFNAGRGERILCFLPDLLNNVNLVFPTFKDSLVRNHQVWTCCDSSFTRGARKRWKAFKTFFCHCNNLLHVMAGVYTEETLRVLNKN